MAAYWEGHRRGWPLCSHLHTQPYAFPRGEMRLKAWCGPRPGVDPGVNSGLGHALMHCWMNIKSHRVAKHLPASQFSSSAKYTCGMEASSHIPTFSPHWRFHLKHPWCAPAQSLWVNCTSHHPSTQACSWVMGMTWFINLHRQCVCVWPS